MEIVYYEQRLSLQVRVAVGQARLDAARQLPLPEVSGIPALQDEAPHGEEQLRRLGHDRGTREQEGLPATVPAQGTSGLGELLTTLATEPLAQTDFCQEALFISGPSNVITLFRRIKR